jgi:hypothetical protein
MHRSLLLLVFHFSFFTIQAQDVSFYKENITMKIEQDYFYVTGNYFLRTTGDQSIILVYPLPVDSLYGEVDSINIFNLTTNHPVNILERKKDVAVFKAEFGEYKEIEILISYRQKLLGNRAEYILESTASWRRPLEQADYQLIAPKGLEIINFAIPPDKSISAGEETIYYWAKKNYMPDRNMKFEFKER